MRAKVQVDLLITYVLIRNFPHLFHRCGDKNTDSPIKENVKQCRTKNNDRTPNQRGTLHQFDAIEKGK